MNYYDFLIGLIAGVLGSLLGLWAFFHFDLNDNKGKDKSLRY